MAPRGKRAPIQLPAEAPAGLRVAESEAVLILSYPLGAGRLPAGLTAAEHGVALAALRGLSNAEIARERGSAVRTVINLLASVFRKLGVHSRAELAALLEG